MRRLLALVTAATVGCGDAQIIRRDQWGGVIQLGSGRDRRDRAAAERIMNAQCGPDGAAVISEGEEVTGSQARTVGGLFVHTTVVREDTEWRIHYRCNDAAPDPSARTTVDMPIGAETLGWWCLSYANGIGFCFREYADCETRRSADQAAAGPAMCRRTPTASCFAMSFAGQPGSVRSCHPSPEACVDQLSFVRLHPEKASALTECVSID